MNICIHARNVYYIFLAPQTLHQAAAIPGIPWWTPQPSNVWKCPQIHLRIQKKTNTTADGFQLCPLSIPKLLVTKIRSPSSSTLVAGAHKLHAVLSPGRDCPPQFTTSRNPKLLTHQNLNPHQHRKPQWTDSSSRNGRHGMPQTRKM